jgi:sporulation protein YabP
MSYDERGRQAVPVRKPHSLSLEARKQLTISGVEEVESFDEREIVMTTSCGSLIIRGEELSVSRLSVESGDVTVRGLVSALSYEEVAPSGSLWARLFH